MTCTGTSCEPKTVPRLWRRLTIRNAGRLAPRLLARQLSRTICLASRPCYPRPQALTGRRLRCPRCKCPELRGGQSCVVDLSIVDQAGEGTVLVDFLADGEPVAVGVGNGARPRATGGDRRLGNAVEIDLAWVAGSGYGSNQRPLIQRNLAGRIGAMEGASIAQIEDDSTGGHAIAIVISSGDKEAGAAVYAVLLAAHDLGIIAAAVDGGIGRWIDPGRQGEGVLDLQVGRQGFADQHILIASVEAKCVVLPVRSIAL